MESSLREDEMQKVLPSADLLRQRLLTVLQPSYDPGEFFLGVLFPSVLGVNDFCLGVRDFLGVNDFLPSLC